MGFEEKAERVVSQLRREGKRGVLIVHHDDGDGLASAAITKACLEREGYTTRTLCLEKVYPEVVEDLHSKGGNVIFYVDIGSSHGDFISKCNSGKNLVVILDHHDPLPATDPYVLDLNLEHFGYKGETDFSGSTCCYLFARKLDEQNVDLAYLALTGACEIPGGFVRLNKEVFDEAVQKGVVEVVGKKVSVVKLGISISKLFSALQILGSVGYYQGGPELGIKACLDGITPDVKRVLEDLEEKRKTANKALIKKLYKERLHETEHVQYFDSGDVYAGMGTKVVGTFCSFLSFQRKLVKPNKYIFGFIKVPTEIPRWGRLRKELVKVSVRVPAILQEAVKRGRMPGAIQILRVVAEEVNGVADGHEFAANITLPTERRGELIERVEEAIKNLKGVSS